MWQCVRGLTQLLSPESLRVRVEAEENALVDEGVLVLRPGALLVLRVCGANDRLKLVAVDETGDVGVGDLRRREADDPDVSVMIYRAQQ